MIFTMGRYRCEPLSQELADEFVEKNHRQGALGVRSISLGLFLKEELIGVLQMGPTRTAAMAKSYSQELYRMAFKAGSRVPGGASKLIKSYIAIYDPSDFFTYQDTTGENTLVYQHSGMALVRDGLKGTKEYLVSPGKTLATAGRREALGLAYATRYGPDRILGTKLGEIFDEATGERKSNRQIFIEELGWHIETTTADSIWEWVNTERTFYTYRITAPNSEKYYYGVSHIKRADATVDECLNDGYMGSGGQKFSNWRARHSEELQKEVISLHGRKAYAYERERELVGSSYLTDPLCLNSRAGGILQAPVRKSVALRPCPIHGETNHNGNTCLKCSAAKNYSEELCPIHGITVFHGGTCKRCKSLGEKTIRECPVHGETKHQGNQCYKCMKKGNTELCGIHGYSTHFGGRCMSCANDSAISIGICPIHGETSHHGDKCYECVNSSTVSLRECPTHGLAKHRGTTCFKCTRRGALVAEMECPVHGLSKHQGNRCVKCSRGAVILKLCETHGETKHRGDACFKCAAAKRKPKG